MSPEDLLKLSDKWQWIQVSLKESYGFWATGTEAKSEIEANLA